MASRTRKEKKVISRSGQRSRAALREVAARRRRRTNLMLAAAGVVLLVIVALIVWVNVRGTASVGPVQRLPTQGNSHIPQGSVSPIEYNSTPPTSGPHYPGLAPWGIYREPIRYEQLIHNLEDGGVVIYYQCPEGCEELVQQLEALVQPYVDAGRHVVLVSNVPGWSPTEGGQPAHRDMGARIALTAWQVLDKFDEFDAERIRAFIERYEGIDHHRG